MTRSNERQRHLIEEHRFRDIILRVQGYIQPDGTRVMPVGHGLNDRPETVEMVSVTMENATSSIMVYARLNTFMIQRYGLLSPADYRLIAEAVGNRVAAETTKIIADGKMKSA